MNLYILENKEAVLVKDHSVWDAWKNEHKKDCLVECTHLYGVTVRTTFRGYDPTGAGYLFCTRIDGKTMVEGCQAQTWEDAQTFHEWKCKEVADEHEVNLSRQAHNKQRS